MENNVWLAIEKVFSQEKCGEYMFMGTETANVDGVSVKVFLYKHHMTRSYLNLDAEGRCFSFSGGRYVLCQPKDWEDVGLGKGFTVQRNISTCESRLAYADGRIVPLEGDGLADIELPPEAQVAINTAIKGTSFLDAEELIEAKKRLYGLLLKKGSENWTSTEIDIAFSLSQDSDIQVFLNRAFCSSKS